MRKIVRNRSCREIKQDLDLIDKEIKDILAECESLLKQGVISVSGHERFINKIEEYMRLFKEQEDAGCKRSKK
jgi:hypothetical protein